MNTEKPDHKIVKNLFSAQTDKVLLALQKIKEKGNKTYLPVLFDLLITNPEEEIEREIKKILGTVKDKETVPGFITALENKKYKTIQKTILIACWQNGMDFSDHLPFFVNLVINEDWKIAFEAFTVIENMEYFPGKEVRKQVSDLINKALENASDQKKYFLEEIMTLIR
ncbi:MAG: hypothetical protein HN778_00290 [Prolixibacteraceae bacterium]|jgi:hypothetical protein|nr:hypothetical protein [Prolixibacteraceae bacterium]MBT6004543.1 hypothetical protein [Prolixibacteraceae bacterium]MBT6763390.1 hypothetical protein [Prolixibacteraceae bacterium]MBT6999905.1 hypothetical protein [Prolixibacteraceae bacterium]MBT7393249.1 hypothetical protein [Prolixibacteraceae bacterium]